jgi:hypothetical protein
MKDRHVLERAGIFKQPLDDNGCLADKLDALGGDLAYHTGRKGRTGERDALELLAGQPKGLADPPDTILAKLNKRFNDAVAEGFLRVDPKLLEDIVLPLDSRDGLIDIGQDR